MPENLKMWMCNRLGSLNEIRLAYKIYAISVFLFVVASLFLFLTTYFTIANATFLVSFFGFSIGFIVWIWPIVVKIWAHPIGKALILALNAIVLLVAAAFSSSVVAHALGLPPKDYSLTVGFVSIVLYPPVWILVIAFFAGALTVIFEVFGLLVMIVSPILETWTLINGPHMAMWLKNRFPPSKIFLNMAGAFFLCLFAAFFFSLSMSAISLAEPTVRRIAFFADYHTASNYPNMKKDQHCILHENGIVSIANIENGKVKIEVKKYEDIK